MHTLLVDVMEIDDDVWQATVVRDDSMVVTVFTSRVQLMEFVRNDAIYGPEARPTTATGNSTVLRH